MVRKVIVYPLTDDNDLWDKIYDSLEEDSKFEISPMSSNIGNQFFLEYLIFEDDGLGEWCKEYNLSEEEKGEYLEKAFKELLKEFGIEVEDE